MTLSQQDTLFPDFTSDPCHEDEHWRCTVFYTPQAWSCWCSCHENAQ